MNKEMNEATKNSFFLKLIVFKNLLSSDIFLSFFEKKNLNFKKKNSL